MAGETDKSIALHHPPRPRGCRKCRRLRVKPRAWRRADATLAAVTAIGTVVHAILIEGTMGSLSKAVRCLLVVAATAILPVDPGNRRRA